MQESLCVRTMYEYDVRMVSEINRLCMPENYRYEYYISCLQECPLASHVCILRSRIIGYVLCRLRLLDTGDNEGLIVSIAVHPNSRGRHVANRLIQEAHAVLRRVHSCKTCTLHVRKSNSAAQHVYETFGYKVVETLPLYYNNEDGLYMRAQI